MAEILTATDADRQLVDAWARGQTSPRTRTAYAHEGAQLLKEVRKPLADVTVVDLQAMSDLSTDLRQPRSGWRFQPSSRCSPSAA